MSSRKSETEILVHITAPSRAADDVDYRALAAAYLAFDPAARTSLGSVTTGSPSVAETPSQQPPETLLPGFRADPFLSPELSFGGVAHNLDSPALRRNPAEGSETRNESQLSWTAPPSIIEDSIPDNNISIARYSSPTRILEHYLQGFDSSQSNTSQPQPNAEAITNRTKSPDTTHQPTLLIKGDHPLPPNCSCNLATSLEVIPQTPASSFSKKSTQPAALTTPSDAAVVVSPAPVQNLPRTHAADDQTSSLRGPVISSAGTSIIPSSLPASTAVFSRSTRADSEPPHPPKRQMRSLSRLNPTALARSTSDIGPRQDQTKRSQLARRQRARQTADGLEIHSPEPPVGCGRLTVSAVLTEKLDKLARDVDIKKRFQPREQRRALRPFERGYWSVDCSAWPDSVRRDAWGFLTNYVSNGDAGWGIWCRRGEDYGWMRLYCWGCAVGHTHLLLYLASRRELNYTGTTWVGGDGEVVIVMEPKYQRTG